MRAASAALPPGYVTIRARYGTAVVQESEARALAAILEESTLYAWAARSASATRYQGRLPAYGVALSGGRARVVVRHATHGGLLAPFTGDRFLAPGRAPRELRVSRFLHDAGVATPTIVGYALYDAGPLLCRNDVVTSEITGASDLPTALATRRHDPRTLLEATARLLVALSTAGAHHADLNLKNVLVVPAGTSPIAYVLDVDRVRLGVEPKEAMRRNLTRFERSARKWRDAHELALSELDLRWLDSRATELGA